MGTGTGSIDLSTLNNLHGNLTQHFWFNSNTGATYGTGVHITLSSQAEFIASPTGQNILMNTDGISIRNGTVPLMVLDNDSLDFNVVTDLAQGTYSNVATFGATGFRMGAITDGETRLVANGGGIDLIRRDGTSDSVLAHFGYDVGIAGSGTAVAPYYTFGTRESDSTVGNYSMAIGENITASGWRSYAEGFLTVASGGTSHAEGNRSVASGSVSHAEGYKTTASSSYTHAEGYESAASGRYSHAEGAGTTSSGAQSHAEGSGTTSSGAYSHAEGYESTAFGDYSHAQNRYTVANGEAQTAIGKYNQPNTTSAFIIGNGTSATALSNALAVDWNGNLKLNGDVYVRCNADSSGGTRLRPLVDEWHNLDNQTIAKSTIGEVWVPIAKSGYTPIGIIGWDIDGGSSHTSNHNMSSLVPLAMCFHTKNNTAYGYAQLRNNSTSPAYVNVRFHVLYMAN